MCRGNDDSLCMSDASPSLMLRTFVIGSAAVLAAIAAGTAPAAAGEAQTCGRPGYSYAGFANATRAHGVRANVAARREPAVANGHVAAWVGVGGPGAGAGGADAWIQVGISHVAGVEGSSLYYEVASPGRAPRYTSLGDVHPGRSHDLAVLEVAGRAGWWRVWVDGRPRTGPLHLAGSSGRWRPIATAEAWDGGRRVCNRFDFAFRRVQVAGSPGGAWQAFVARERFEDPGYRLLAETGSSFRATAV